MRGSLPPATKLGQGYVCTRVCDSVHGGGGPVSVHAGIPTPWQGDPPARQTPPGEEDPPCAVHAGRYGERAGGMHPTGMQFLLLI